MNANTVLGFYSGTGRNQIPSVTLASATETAVVVGTDTSGTTATAFLVIPVFAPQGASSPTITGSFNSLDPDVNGAQLVRYGGVQSVPLAGQRKIDSLAFDGSPFRVALYGTATPASNAANTFQLKLYQGTSTTLASDNNFAATGALTGTDSSTTPFNFAIQADMCWDSTSQALNGQFYYQVGVTGGYNTWKAATQVTSVTAAKLSFLASYQWGNAVGGTIQVTEFSISAL